MRRSGVFVMGPLYATDRLRTTAWGESASAQAMSPLRPLTERGHGWVAPDRRPTARPATQALVAVNYCRRPDSTRHDPSGSNVSFLRTAAIVLAACHAAIGPLSRVPSVAGVIGTHGLVGAQGYGVALTVVLLAVLESGVVRGRLMGCQMR